MFDTIPFIKNDDVLFFLNKNIVDQQPDSFQIGFSSFEFIPTDKNKLFFDIDTNSVSMLQSTVADGFHGIQMPYSQTVLTVFFLFFVICLVFVSFWFNKESSLFIGNFKNIFSGGVKGRSVYKEQITATSAWGELFLVFQTMLVLSMVLYSVLWEKGISVLSIHNKIILFIAFFLGFLLFTVLKYLVYRLIDYIFSEWGLRDWIDRYFTLVGLTGLLVYLPAMFVIFSPECSKAAFFLLMIVFFIIMLIAFRNLLNIFAKNKIGLLNYFLYLCAIEIVPLLLIYKGVIMLVNFAGN